MIIYVRITEDGPFLMLRFEVRPVIRHFRNTEGGPFLMLCLEARPVISVTGFVLVAMKTQKTCCWFVSHPIYYIDEDDEKPCNN